MCSRLSGYVQLIAGDMRTAITDRELRELQIDITTLNVMRVPPFSSLEVEDHTFHPQGLELNDQQQHFVGFCGLQHSVLSAVTIKSYCIDLGISLNIVPRKSKYSSHSHPHALLHSSGEKGIIKLSQFRIQLAPCSRESVTS